jgi:thiol-disulfide isomerase/thioredoxin
MIKSLTWVVAIGSLGLQLGVSLGNEPAESSRAATENRAATAEANPTAEARQPFTVRVMDKQGLAVSGAFVGQHAGRIADRGPDWEFAGVIENSKFRPAVTGADGQTEMFVDDIARQDLVLVARHASRKLTGLKKMSRDQLVAASRDKSTIEISLQPECRVRGKLQSTGLIELRQKLKNTVADVELDGRGILTFISSHQSYEFFLPPGSYTLESYGNDTVVKQLPFQVPEAKAELDLDVIDLPPTNMARLIGKPAPEIRDVIAWKNTKPLKLSDLHGKYVLLDFWGYWCGPCVQSMPDLIALHEKYARRGLVIIGVHVGLENDAVNTVEQLDATLAATRKEIWGGRDLPFPVAMVAARETPTPGSEREGRCQASVDYGVLFFPSAVLIDPEGKVVGDFDEKEHVKRFDELPRIRE